MLFARLFRNPGFAGLALVVGLATINGCTAPRAVQFEHKRAGRVYCLRGLMDVFSLGLNGLAEKLRAEGVDARAMSGSACRAAARQIESDYAAGSDLEPLILVGHSYGADHAVELAKHLQRRGIRVQLLVLLDATAPPTVPASVERCLHLYKPTTMGDLLPAFFAGNPVALDRDNRETQIFNEIVSTDVFGPEAAAVNHFNIDASEAVHAVVIREIVQICPPYEPTTAFSDSDSRRSPTPALKACHATP
jgi:pimeloyl-ACP methyl ester carboxylesterase